MPEFALILVTTRVTFGKNYIHPCIDSFVMNISEESVDYDVDTLIERATVPSATPDTTGSSKNDDGDEREPPVAEQQQQHDIEEASSSSSPPVPHHVEEEARLSYFLQWSQLCKTVQVKDASNGLMRSSIADNGYGVKKKKKNWKSKQTGGGALPEKVILSDVSGSTAPGKVLALIGPSGSGKTSLLNALSGRTSIDSGVISVNGRSLTGTVGTTGATDDSTKGSSSQVLMKRFVSKVAYVQQEDIFFTHLTVQDQLAYTAFLRLPQAWTRSEKLAQVYETVRALRLSKVQNSPIKLLSGGEKKRVNIGTELLTNPSCVILDEPTSGLDSTSAVALVKLLQRLARAEQKTILMSIHQPSSGMFLSFDNLLLLAEGHVVYHGTPHGSIQYLKDRGLACPEGYNAADHWMDLLVTDSSLEEEEEFAKSSHFLGLQQGNGNNNNAASFRNRKSSARLNREKFQSSRRTTRQQLIDAWESRELSEHMDAAAFQGDTVSDLSLPVQKYNTSWTAQYRVLVHRALKNSRSAIFTPLNMIKSIVLGIIVGMMWFQLPYTERTVRDRSGYFFFTMTYWVFDSMFGALLAFPMERKVIQKERASASYHLSAYFMAKTTSEAPTRLSLPLLYMTISFWMAGMSTKFSLFVYTTFISLLSVLAGESYGLLVGASIDQMDRAFTAITILALMMMIVGGFYVQNVPSFISWVKYISPFKYSYDACRSIVFDEPVPCDGSGELQELCNSGQEYVSPEDLQAFLDIDGTLPFNVSMLIVLGLVPRYFAYIALKMKKGGGR